MAHLLETAYKGTVVSEILDENKRFELLVWYEEKARKDPQVINKTILDTLSGSKVSLGQVAQVLETTGPNTLNHENVQRRIVVSCNVQGRDLADAYIREARDWRDEFFYEHPTITSRDRIPSSPGVIRRDWKYVYWPEWSYEQLFNLEQDALEVRNLAGDPEHAADLARMKQKLADWRQLAK